MLELRKYSRSELIQLFNTNRLDAIKAKIIRQGYKFNDNGRGNNYVMEITELPTSDQQLKQYCINTLLFPPQIDIKKLKVFLLNYLTNEQFITLQHNEMKEEIEQQGISISLNTISSYCNQLISIGWSYGTNTDFTYYVFDNNIQHNRYISKEEYCQMYQDYWNTVKQEQSFYNAEIEIRKKYGNKPKKRQLLVKNGIYNQQYQEVLDLIKGD